MSQLSAEIRQAIEAEAKLYNELVLIGEGFVINEKVLNVFCFRHCFQVIFRLGYNKSASPQKATAACCREGNAWPVYPGAD